MSACCVGKPSSLYDDTNPAWAPSIHLGGAPKQERRATVSRYERMAQRREKRRRFDADDGLLSLSQVAFKNTLSL